VRKLLVLTFLCVLVGSAAASSERVPRLVFPVVGQASYRDDFGDPRGQGTHQGIDIVAPRKAVAVAAEPGTVQFWTTSASAGCMLYLRGKSGTVYQYIHLNNDVGKGNDNRGRCVPGVAYAPGLLDGAQVAAGQPIGFVGDSGDANGIQPHLHFEVHPGDKAAVDPFRYLNRAQRLLFAAAPGSTVTLSLAGTVLAADLPKLSLRVKTLQVFPGRFVLRKVSKTVGLTLAPDSLGGIPPSTVVSRDVVVLTEPEVATLPLLLGKGLTASRVAATTR
jgi:hypothetical protein